MLERLQSLVRGPKAEAVELTASSLPFLPSYGGQSTAQLISLAPAYRLDSVIQAFEMGIGQKEQRLGSGSLTTSELTVLAVEDVEREVNADGFDGLFRNASREHAPYFVASLEAIGRSDVADLVRRAIAALRLGKQPLSSGAIDRVMARGSTRRDEAFDELDTEYWKIAGDLASDLFAYIQAHANEIDLPGQAAIETRDIHPL